jgi:hypothetical protein
MLHFKGNIFGFGSPYFLKKLVKIAPGTIIVEPANPIFDPAREAVSTGSVYTRSFPHGILPADLFTFFNLLLHSQVIFAGVAIEKIVTVFKFYNTGLHPDTRICSFGLLVRLKHPDLSAKDRPDLRFFSEILPGSLSVRRTVTKPTFLNVSSFFCHFPDSFV